MTWEYRVISQASTESFNEALSAAATQGWDMFGEVGRDPRGAWYCVMRRKRDDKGKEK